MLLGKRWKNPWYSKEWNSSWFIQGFAIFVQSSRWISWFGWWIFRWLFCLLECIDWTIWFWFLIILGDSDDEDPDQNAAAVDSDDEVIDHNTKKGASSHGKETHVTAFNVTTSKNEASEDPTTPIHSFPRRRSGAFAIKKCVFFLLFYFLLFFIVMIYNIPWMAPPWYCIIFFHDGRRLFDYIVIFCLGVFLEKWSLKKRAILISLPIIRLILPLLQLLPVSFIPLPWTLKLRIECSTPSFDLIGTNRSSISSTSHLLAIDINT